MKQFYGVGISGDFKDNFNCANSDAGTDPQSFSDVETAPDLLIAVNGSIIIRSAERRHEGRYQCTADNGIGKALVKTVSLKVNGEDLVLISNFLLKKISVGLI